MSHNTARKSRRRGFSYLETQVASVLFMLTLSGVVPLFVIQTRQLNRIESRFEPAKTQYLIQPEGRWAKKLGAPALLSDKPPEPADPTSPTYGTITIDDRDAGYSEQNRSFFDWYRIGWSAAYGSDFTLNYPDEVDDRAIWEFTDLKAGKYDILVTYPIFGFANKDAKYEFFLNGEDEGDKKVDQRKSLRDPLVDGVRWKKLDSIKIKQNDSTLRVELSDEDANGYNVIDAMRLVPEEPEMFLHKVDAPLDEEYMEVLVHMDYSVDVEEAKN